MIYKNINYQNYTEMTYTLFNSEFLNFLIKDIFILSQLGVDLYWIEKEISNLCHCLSSW